MNEPIDIISLGAGVQSSTMALMAAAGEITPMPHCAIFADTGDEPEKVYEWLAWMEKHLPFSVHRVTAGKLSDAAIRVRVSEAGNKYMKPSLPVFFQGAGMGGRQCTMDYKITVITRKLAAIRRDTGAPKVIQWIGISSDEKRRMKPSRVSYVDNVWPLVKREMSRHACLRWMESKGFPKPPRSACRYCPFHSDAEWRRIREEEPEEFELAAQFEERLQAAALGVTKGVPFLHSSRVPLREVDLSTDEDHGQQTLWSLECEGMCGL